MIQSKEEELNILVEIKENPLKSLWNSGLRTKRSSQQIKDDMRKEFKNMDNVEFVQK